MEEREKEKNSFFATLSKPENKELKGFLKVYTIIALVNIVTVITSIVLIFLIGMRRGEVELAFWIQVGLVIGLILFNLISYYVFLLPRAYRFGVKFLIPKIIKDLGKELDLEDLIPKIIKDLSKELDLEDLKKKKELNLEDLKKKIT